MGYAEKSPGNSCWTIKWNNAISSEFYLKLHFEMTLLAYSLTGEMESAKDIASECLIFLWESIPADSGASFVKSYLFDKLNQLCGSLAKSNWQRKYAEHSFFSALEEYIPAYKAFRIADRLELYHYSRLLDPPEQSVIRLILLYEMDLPEISDIIGKPIATTKNIKDRAVYQLRKRFNPKELPINLIS